MEPICEACGEKTEIWTLDAADRLFRCPKCGHVLRSLDEAPCDARGHAWGGVGFFDRVRTAFTWRSQSRWLAARGIAPDRVLELGFGAGLMLRRHLALGRKCAGVEANLLETGLPAEIAGKFDFRSCDAEAMSFPPASFDLAFAVHVVEHLREPNRVFALLFDALAPGGAVHFLTPNGDSAGLRLFGARWWNLEDPTHVRFYSPESIRLMLERAGFADVEVRRPGWDSLVLEGASFARIFLRRNGTHGVMSRRAGRLLALCSAPFFFLARLFVPALRPSIEVFARKPGVR